MDWTVKNVIDSKDQMKFEVLLVIGSQLLGVNAVR
jgi:hypothetical protein